LQNFIKKMANFPKAFEGENICAVCGDPISPEKFRDELSLKEWKISKMCQVCQDKVFGKNE